MLNIFKQKTKSVDDLKQEQYVERLKTVTEHYNGIRINEVLVGQISVIKKMSNVFESNKEYLMLSKTVPRPKVFVDGEDGQKKEIAFKTPSEWLNHIHEEYKNVVNKIRKYAEEEKEYQESLRNKMIEETLKKKREFLIGYGVLSA